MSKLEHCLSEAGFKQIQALKIGFEQESKDFIQSNQSLFKHACENKPDNSSIQTLLGLLTKTHIDASYEFSSDKDASEAMQQVLEETVGQEHSQKFSHSSSKKLQFITHLWLFVQGRMGMDYSLANDHAAATASLLCRIVRQTEDEIRVSFMGSFYDGLSIYQDQNKPSGLIHNLKRLFNLS